MTNFPAGAGDLAGVEVYRGFPAYHHAVHAGAGLGDCPLFSRADNLSGLSGLDGAGFSPQRAGKWIATFLSAPGQRS